MKTLRQYIGLLIAGILLCWFRSHNRCSLFDPNPIHQCPTISENTFGHRSSALSEIVSTPVAEYPCKSYPFMVLSRTRFFSIRPRFHSHLLDRRRQSHCLLCLCMDCWVFKFLNTRGFGYSRGIVRIVVSKLYVSTTSGTRRPIVSDMDVVG